MAITEGPTAGNLYKYTSDIYKYRKRVGVLVGPVLDMEHNINESETRAVNGRI